MSTDRATRPYMVRAFDLHPGLFFELVLAVSLILVLKLGVALATKNPFHAVPPGRSVNDFDAVSVAVLVPRGLVISRTFHTTVAVAMVVAAVAWLAGTCRRAASLVCCLSLVIALSIHYTLNSVLHHRYHLLCQVLIVYALHASIYGSRDGGGLPAWRRALLPSAYPGWVFQLSMFTICMAYTHAGISKLRVSGLGWSDGAGLQAWVWAKGHNGYEGIGRILAEMTLNNAWVASAIATTSLVLEAACIVAFFAPRSRPFFGAGLLLMHLGIYLILGILFPYNILVVILFFFGVKARLERRVFSPSP